MQVQYLENKEYKSFLKTQQNISISVSPNNLTLEENWNEKNVLNRSV